MSSNCCDEFVHENQIGFRFRFVFTDNCGAILTLDPTDTLEAVFCPPNLPNFKKTLTITDGDAGEAEYVTVDGDISEPGAWSVQGHMDSTVRNITAPGTRYNFQVLSVSKVTP